MAGSTKNRSVIESNCFLLPKKTYSNANKKSSHVKNDFEFIYITQLHTPTYCFTL